MLSFFVPLFFKEMHVMISGKRFEYIWCHRYNRYDRLAVGALTLGGWFWATSTVVDVC